MRKRIKYIAAYDIDANKEENRVNILSSANKINYIISVLNELGYEVDIISTSSTLNRKCYMGKFLRWNNNSIKLFPTTWRGGIVFKLINMIVINTALLIYILRYIKMRDTVIVYHSYGNMWLYPLLKVKKVKLINECEEVYGDIFGRKWLSYIEKKALRLGDAYIYPTELLNSILNLRNKPYLIVHGTYKELDTQFFSDNTKEVVKFTPEQYHIAYTGILDAKKGCLEVIKAAEFLDESYYIHILGFGSPSQVKEVQNLIDDIQKKTKCKITFDGIRRGQEYTNYLSYIDLGICTLDVTQQFIMTQFPSKIISYMAAGVSVLCSDIKALKSSYVAEALTFYKGNAPIDIAKGIKLARRKGKVNMDFLLEKCHIRFKNELQQLLSSV